MQALDANNNPAAAYDEHIGTSFDLKFNEEKNTTCTTGTLDLGSIAFTDGNSSVTTYYTETGMLDFNLSEIPGSEFAVVDADDTPDSDRFISSATASDIGFKVASFEISDLAMLHGATSFTYYTAPADMQQMAATLRFNVKAKNARGDITANYTDGCYAKEVLAAIYFDTNGTATQNNTLAWQEDGNSSHTVENALTFSGSISNYFVYDIAEEKFTDGENSNSVKINFNRAITLPKEPMRFNITKVHVANADDRTGTITQTLTTDFYYGRLHASDYMAVGNKLDAKIFYEVYCNKCDRQNLFTLANRAESTDQVRWYIISDYHDGVSGFSGVTGTYHPISVSTSLNSTTISAATSPSAVTNGVDVIEFEIPSEDLPFKERIKYLPKPWLIFKKFVTSDNRHTFDIDLSALPNNWAGKGNEGYTVDLNVSGRKGNLKIDW